MLFCKIHISSLVNPNWVVPIFLRSWWSLVFRKNIIWALILQYLEELNWNLKCVFKCMQTCLNYILSSCDPKNYEICMVSYSWWVEALVKIWESLHVGFLSYRFSFYHWMILVWIFLIYLWIQWPWNFIIEWSLRMLGKI